MTTYIRMSPTGTNSRVKKPRNPDSILSCSNQFVTEGYEGKLSIEDYVQKYGKVGQVFLELKGTVVEEEQFEKKTVLPKVGEVYYNYANNKVTCVEVGSVSITWMRTGGRYFATDLDGKNSCYYEVKLNTEKVFIGKKKVLK